MRPASRAGTRPNGSHAKRGTNGAARPRSGSASDIVEPFIYRIDPIMGEIASIHLWFDGRGYGVGFFGIYPE
jgi:hypothetical protein